MTAANDVVLSLREVPQTVVQRTDRTLFMSQSMRYPQLGGLNRRCTRGAIVDVRQDAMSQWRRPDSDPSTAHGGGYG